MAQRTQELLDKIEAAHDWRNGQVYGGSGTRLSSIDECRVCGMNRHWFSDRQNGVTNEYTFSDEQGGSLTLREAAAREC